MSALSIKSLWEKLFTPQQRDSFLWDLSGSTFAHIFIIFGIGFYVGLPSIQPIQRTISINLQPFAELSSINQTGLGMPLESSQLNHENRKQKEVVHISSSRPTVNNNTLILEQQRLIEAINQQNKLIKSSERIGFLSTHETEPAFLAYQEYWQHYIGEFGTRHYPRTLVNSKLDGSLQLDIAIDASGEVRSANIHRSSGHAIIDEAAVALAIQASPYAPLPQQIRDEVDILHIIRTWHFNNQTLVSQ